MHVFFFLVLLGEEKEKGERQRGKKKTDIEVAKFRTSLLLFSLVEKIYPMSNMTTWVHDLVWLWNE